MLQTPLSPREPFLCLPIDSSSSIQTPRARDLKSEVRDGDPLHYCRPSVSQLATSSLSSFGHSLSPKIITDSTGKKLRKPRNSLDSSGEFNTLEHDSIKGKNAKENPLSIWLDVDTSAAVARLSKDFDLMFDDDQATDRNVCPPGVRNLSHLLHYVCYLRQSPFSHDLFPAPFY